MRSLTCASALCRSSFVCGLAGALASNPVDVVRTRMMNQRGGALYQGTLDCLLQVSHIWRCSMAERWAKGTQVTTTCKLSSENAHTLIFFKLVIQRKTLEHGTTVESLKAKNSLNNKKNVLQERKNKAAGGIAWPTGDTCPRHPPLHTHTPPLSSLIRAACDKFILLNEF